jgi:hypothetical protein
VIKSDTMTLLVAFMVVPRWHVLGYNVCRVTLPIPGSAVGLTVEITFGNLAGTFASTPISHVFPGETTIVTPDPTVFWMDWCKGPLSSATPPGLPVHVDHMSGSVRGGCMVCQSPVQSANEGPVINFPSVA